MVNLVYEVTYMYKKKLRSKNGKDMIFEIFECNYCFDDVILQIS